jgi:hypothetical protein
MITDDHDEQDDLWRLLGKAKEPVPSPMFSRNVLRAIREEAQERPSVFSWLRGHWQVAAVGACAVAISALVVFPQEDKKRVPSIDDTALLAERDTTLLAEKVSQSSDFHVIAVLDELIASEESSVWLEN